MVDQKYLDKAEVLIEALPYEDFLYVTEKNNRADELANIGIDSIR